MEFVLMVQIAFADDNLTRHSMTLLINTGRRTFLLCYANV